MHGDTGSLFLSPSRSSPRFTSFWVNRRRSWLDWHWPKKWRWPSPCRCWLFIECSNGPYALSTGPARAPCDCWVSGNFRTASSYTEAELRQLIDISREGGHLRSEERRLIHRVFEFSDTLVREAMVPRTAIAAIPAECTLEEITKAFEQTAIRDCRFIANPSTM